ncbi:MAG TPA: methyl-accepting chemotaxis protein [Gemmatimonadales bacterium]
MRFFRSLRRMNSAAMTCSVVLVLGMAALGVSALGRMTRQMAGDIATLQEGSSLGASLVSVVLGEIRAAERYLLTPTLSVKAGFVASGDSAYTFLGRLEELPNLAANDRRLIHQVANSQATLEVAYATAHALVDLGRNDEAHRIAARAAAVTDTLVDMVRQLSNAQARHAIARSRELQNQARFYQRLLLLGAILALAVGIGAGLGLIRTVDRHMGRLTAAVDRFGGGDLRPVTIRQVPDEITRLTQSLDTMAGRLRGVVASVVRESHQVSVSAGDFSAMSEEIAASSGQVSSAMVKISTAAEHQVRGMNEADQLLGRLRESSAANAEAAQRAVRLAEEIRRTALRYRGDVDAARSTLLDVRGVVQRSSRQVRALVEQSASITDFIDLIKRISSQTNLLALNAAIEAARAGEHGRGFSVVADEVRQLADSSASAAGEVTKTVDSLRAQVKEIEATMEVGTSKVAGIESVAQAVVQGLDAIGTAIGEVQTTATTLSRQTEQSRDIVGELAERAALVASAATEHAASAEEVSAAAQEQSASTLDMAASASALLDASTRLTKLTEGFQT